MNPKLLTPAQRKALTYLSVGPLTRSGDGWVAATGASLPLITVSKVRNLGLAQLSADRRSLSLTADGQTTVRRME